MTTNQTIDGVPRKTLDSALNGCGLEKTEALRELRALLDAPAVNTDVRTILLDVVPGDGDGHEVYATCCDDVVAILSKQQDRIEKLEVAQPQGEPVAYLHTMHADGAKSRSCLLFTKETPWAEDAFRFRQRHEVQALYAEQPRGVPVAWLVKCKNSGLVEQAEPHQKATNPAHWTDAFPVYAEQPAPVAVGCTPNRGYGASVDVSKLKPFCCGSCPGGCLEGAKP